MNNFVYFWLGTLTAISLRLFVNKFDYWDIAYCGFVGLLSIGLLILEHKRTE